MNEIIIGMAFLVIIIFSSLLPQAFGHQELRNDMPVLPHALTFCFMRYDSKDSGEERDTYLECNMVEGFTQQQLRDMRQTLEEWANR